jgi:hypothetical protein
MNDIDILKTSCKVFGLYFLIQTIMNIRELVLYPIVYALDGTENIFAFLGASIYQCVFNLLIGLVLIFKADTITQKLNPGKTGELKLNFEKADWIELSLIIISGLALLNALPEILHKLVYYLYFNDYERHERAQFWTSENKADLFYSIFKFGVALILLLNARNFSLRLKKVGDKDDKFMGKED